MVPLGDHADGEHSRSIAAYLELLQAEINGAPAGPPLSTVYVGGGTPSMLSPGQLRQLLQALRRRYGLAPGAEVTLEMDPASFDAERLAGHLAAGVNRVSMGGQSFDDAVLERLGRRHRRADLLQAAGWLEAARRRGELASWSLDLLQGLPGQTLEHWQAQLRQAIALGPPHLSVYDLIVEPGTVFERLEARGQLDLPEPDLAADLMELTARQLAAAGYGHYEISNYAQPGHASATTACIGVVPAGGGSAWGPRPPPGVRGRPAPAPARPTGPGCGRVAPPPLRDAGPASRCPSMSG